MSRKGLLGIGLLLACIAAVAIILWPSEGSSADKNTDTPQAKATPTAPSATAQYFNDISKAVKAGDLQQQASYVAEYVRQDFLRGGVLMFPKGTTVAFQEDTLVAETPTTGHIKATVSGTRYVVLLVKEKDSAGHMVWHISDTEEVKS